MRKQKRINLFKMRFVIMVLAFVITLITMKPKQAKAGVFVLPEDNIAPTISNFSTRMHDDGYMVSCKVWDDVLVAKVLLVVKDVTGKNDNILYSKWIEINKQQFNFAQKITWADMQNRNGNFEIILKAYDEEEMVSKSANNVVQVPRRTYFDANGGVGGPDTVVASLDAPDKVVIPTKVPTREHYTFVCWRGTDPDCSIQTFRPGETSVLWGYRSNLFLKAEWKLAEISLLFDYNDSTGNTYTEEISYGNNFTFEKCSRYLAGAEFLGWNTKKDGTGTSYKPGDVINVTAPLTFYAQWKKIPNYTITFDANGGTNPPASQEKVHNETLVLVMSDPERKGYTFSKWSTNKDGTGKSYLSGFLYTENADLTLYAQWKTNTYDINYFVKSVSGEYVRVKNQIASYLSEFELLDYIPSSGGATFRCWNTKMDGSGKDYYPSQKYICEGDINLYPQWNQKSSVVTYNANGGSGAPGNQTKTIGKDLVLSSVKPTRTGYTFNGWNTKADGSGTAYAAGTTYKADTDLTLYAQWKIVTYTVSYNANGGSNAPAAQTKTYGKDLTLSTTKPTRTGYSFTGWNTKADGSGTAYAAGAVYKANAKVTLYAQWKIATYAVSYNANGGSNAPAAQTKTYGKDLTLSTTKPTRTGYSFTGWNTKADGSGTAYAAGAVYKANAKATLYAQWSIMEKGNPFADVAKDSWMFAPANFVYEKKIMVGTGTNSVGKVVFKPNGTLTRAEFVTTLYNMEGKPSVTYKSTFTDVPKGQWYTNPIIWASNMKITSGYGKTFGVTNSITREQMAQMLYSYAKIKGYSTKIISTAINNYKDKSKISTWAVDAMKWAVTNGVMKGKGETLDPTSTATRAECAAMLKNFWEAFKK